MKRAFDTSSRDSLSRSFWVLPCVCPVRHLGGEGADLRRYATPQWLRAPPGHEQYTVSRECVIGKDTLVK